MAELERADRKKNPLEQDPTSPYDALAREAADEHPVDLLISRRLPQEQLRRRMRKASDRLTRLLGDRRQEWLAVEELWNDYRLDREKAYFDLGHEQGVRLGRAEALRGGPSGEEIQPLVGRISASLSMKPILRPARGWSR
jgi:hypothetical protein